MTDKPKTAVIPSARTAVVTGSANWGLAFPEDVGMAGVRVLERDLAFDTPYGVTENWKLLEFDASLTEEGRTKQVLCMYSHGNPRDYIDHSCHRRAFWVLKEAGVRRILACSMLGAVNKAIQTGDMVINADIIELTQTPYSLLEGRQRFDCSGKQLVCPHCAALLVQTARKHWPASRRIHGVELGLVAAHSYGPRLTSPAEAMAFRSMGADVINHSIAPEATLSREIGACFTPLAFVTAGYNDYMDRSRGQLLQDNVLPGLSMITSRVALETVARFSEDQDCGCHMLKSPRPAENYARF
ncbi:5'-methylthioadenosine phosphorylase [Rhizobium anhuiense]|uniref:5'-methylthioadenosine phosphorylase n=1 Tax=Rhizobium anhuiense TaxID=1184720 RepID=A0ABX4J075_9HYPH|nr:5'-methylthioadenosine phosphorylase [Rhizobium anhuiense]PDS35083.1 5'-methylthioadenosine phosphorylase [Rhizobium anhuiense]PDS41277.1 5'-methylthioadenosine phosphorylase [Rhizobium anhuiense]PDS48447.1 5'-methylthioadenosine phosphorylase [Rhizobium anhuiense]